MACRAAMSSKPAGVNPLSGAVTAHGKVYELMPGSTIIIDLFLTKVEQCFDYAFK